MANNILSCAEEQSTREANKIVCGFAFLLIKINWKSGKMLFRVRKLVRRCTEMWKLKKSVEILKYTHILPMYVSSFFSLRL